MLATAGVAPLVYSESSARRARSLSLGALAFSLSTPCESSLCSLPSSQRTVISSRSAFMTSPRWSGLLGRHVSPSRIHVPSSRKIGLVTRAPNNRMERNAADRRAVRMSDCKLMVIGRSRCGSSCGSFGRRGIGIWYWRFSFSQSTAGFHRGSEVGIPTSEADR